MGKIPVTIVTGALGAGKTTFVNFVLTATHGLKIGVIVNEFGAVGIDGDLLRASTEQLIELPNGCICCTVRDDLIKASLELIATNKIDFLMIETSGMAEVLPAAMTFNAPELVDKAELDSILCVIDGMNYEENAKRNPTAKEQLECSDIVLLSKIDLVDRKQVEQIKQEIKKIVPNAVILETVKGQVDLKLVLGLKFKHKEKEWKKSEHEHAHNIAVESASCVIGPADSDKLQLFLENLPDNIFRAKGILCIKESVPGARDELRIVFQKVGKRTELEFSRPWLAEERKETKVVFIGTKLNHKALQEELEKCV